ncbi:MAG: phosphoribosylformylglycinamidine synthase subunit PurL [Ignavibacteriae bacterium]|nr:phosphoribosylformylglycinamidine synthase subunit PurL [Ignavibacteriota bacterium]
MSHDIDVTIELARELGLTDDEYAQILEYLGGRTPTYTELGMYSVMWSEHCSYKNSIAHLKTLPRSGGRLLVGAGEENAGLVDIGDGLAIAFKIESHNHPSAIEPFQGAATGVGGILRDVFTMGARPIAACDSLRFGSLDNPRVRFLLRGVVSGIGHYGNCFGVPTVAGEIYFDPSYTGNPLVNAMAVGIVRHGQVASAVASGEGNPVMIVGSSTGRDGIHGATFASVEISEESESKRPSVQVGDPFTEKLLLEATLEIIKEDLIIGIQDMGAAGITCSSTEMSAKGGAGMDVDLDLVPARETGMSAYEIMLSESQERMLVVVKKGNEARVREIFDKWDLHAVTIGHVTSDGLVTIRHQGRVLAQAPAHSMVLGGGAPVYHRETQRPEYLDVTAAFRPESVPVPTDLTAVLQELLATPNIASKRWVYEQYDTSVRTNSAQLPGGDAAVIRIKDTNKAIAVKTDCNGRYVYLNPRRGAMIAVAESARNVVCTGAEPLAITNCLNFGNPYKPEMFYMFAEAVAGMGEACRVFGTPVTGGNVSFYNEDPAGAVYPTPVIGMLGLIEDVDAMMTAHFRAEGDLVFLIGANQNDIGGSEYLAAVHGIVAGDAPHFDIEEEQRVQKAVLAMIRARLLSSSHDVSDGGLAVALAECCVTGPSPIGAHVRVYDTFRRDALYFGEAQSRVIVSCNPARKRDLVQIAMEHEVEIQELGVVGGSALLINDDVSADVREMADRYWHSLERRLADPV